MRGSGAVRAGAPPAFGRCCAKPVHPGPKARLKTAGDAHPIGGQRQCADYRMEQRQGAVCRVGKQQKRLPVRETTKHRLRAWLGNDAFFLGCGGYGSARGRAARIQSAPTRGTKFLTRHLELCVAMRTTEKEHTNNGKDCKQNGDGRQADDPVRRWEKSEEDDGAHDRCTDDPNKSPRRF